MKTLDMDGYVRLGKRRPDFDAWLEAEGLKHRSVYRMDFDEGSAVIHCYAKDEHGKHYVDGSGVHAAVEEPQRVKLSTPPPILDLLCA
jgi:hypothetical protein